jgi:transcription elongation GreA/GreB family factor
MHKLIVSLRKVARGEESTVETVDATSGDEELVFLVGPRAAGFAVGRTSHP